MTATATRRRCSQPGCITLLSAHHQEREDKCWVHTEARSVAVLDASERNHAPGHRATLKQYRRLS